MKNSLSLVRIILCLYLLQCKENALSIVLYMNFSKLPQCRYIIIYYIVWPLSLLRDPFQRLLLEAMAWLRVARGLSVPSVIVWRKEM